MQQVKVANKIKIYSSLLRLEVPEPWLVIRSTLARAIGQFLTKPLLSSNLIWKKWMTLGCIVRGVLLHSRLSIYDLVRITRLSLFGRSHLYFYYLIRGAFNSLYIFSSDTHRHIHIDHWCIHNTHINKIGWT